MVFSLSRGILKGGFSSIVSEGKGDIEGGWGVREPCI